MFWLLYTGPPGPPCTGFFQGSKGAVIGPKGEPGDKGDKVR